MSNQPRRAMTMREIRDALGHTKPKPTVTATRYEVSLLPEDDINRPVYTITVESRGDGRWAVCWMRECLATDGTWSHEPIPSSRDDAWLANHRFDLDTALRLAREQAPQITVNGMSATEVFKRTRPTP